MVEIMWISISIAVIILLLALIFFVKKIKNKKPLTPLSGFAFGLVIAGITFGENRAIAYSLMGLGVILAVVDAFLKQKK